MKNLFAVLTIGSILVLTGCSSNETPQLTLEAATYEPVVTDDYGVRLQVSVKNTNQSAIAVTCHITPYDSASVKLAEPISVSVDSLNPGERDLLIVDYPFASGNARNVASAKGNCDVSEAEATDWPLIVSEVSDCSFYDEETKESFWYACFSIEELEPSSKVTCKVLAISPAEYPILKFIFKGNVGMNKSVSPYKVDMPTGPKELVESIDKFEIRCQNNGTVG
jgi:uncharacterized protein YcfL